MTEPAPITVEQLMSDIIDYGELLRRNKPSTQAMRDLRLSIEQFAAEQRAQGAAELREENARLRRSLVNCALAVGAVAPDRSSIDFLELIPEEVRLCFEKNYAAIEQLRAELAATKQRLEAVEYDSIQRIANDVCEKLPHGFTLSLWMENGAAWVELCENELLPLNEDTESSISDQIFYALTVAIAAEAKEPCKHLRRQTHKSIVSPGVERDRCADCGELLSIGAAQEKGE